MPDQEEYLEELTRINNELANVSRELARKNARLERSKKIEIERARLVEGQVFSGSVAHMMNNIMTNISLSLDMIENKGHLDDDGKSLLEIIRNEIRRSTNLIDRLLLVTHMDKESSEPFELDTLVNKVIDGFSVRKSPIEAIYGGSGFLTDADSKLVHMALKEIVANSIEASSEAEFKPVIVETGVDNDKEYLVVKVTDYGPGISEDIADRIFLPFVTSRFLGRGLGLAVAKHAINACGGEIHWSRSAGATLFTLSLPVFRG